MKILHLTIKKKLFDMILSGEKREEYREVKPYWDKRLISSYCPMHFENYQLLTKRPERRAAIFELPEFYTMLTKYCNQYHDKYVRKLEQELYFEDEIKSLFPFYNIWEGTSVENDLVFSRVDNLRSTKAHIRWISAEPLLGSIKNINLTGIDWVVIGGESGNKKRPFEVEWFREIRDKCKNEGVAFFMKQMDKKQEIPEDLMVRQFPTLKQTK